MKIKETAIAMFNDHLMLDILSFEEMRRHLINRNLILWIDARDEGKLEENSKNISRLLKRLFPNDSYDYNSMDTLIESELKSKRGYLMFNCSISRNDEWSTIGFNEKDVGSIHSLKQRFLDEEQCDFGYTEEELKNLHFLSIDSIILDKIDDPSIVNEFLKKYSNLI